MEGAGPAPDGGNRAFLPPGGSLGATCPGCAGTSVLPLLENSGSLGYPQETGNSNKERHMLTLSGLI